VDRVAGDAGAFVHSSTRWQIEIVRQEADVTTAEERPR
jgi:hypothetical protein